MTTHSTIYVDNTMVVQLDGLKDHNGNSITDATVTLETLKDKGGNDITGVTLPLTLSHISGGKYEGNLTKDVNVTAGKLYKAVVKAVSGSLTAEWTETLIAQERAS